MYELMPGRDKFIKIQQIKPNGFVEFLFAIDQVTMNVEMVLPCKEFLEFCDRNRVSFVTYEQEELMKKDNILWQYGTDEFL